MQQGMSLLEHFDCALIPLVRGHAQEQARARAQNHRDADTKKKKSNRQDFRGRAHMAPIYQKYAGNIRVRVHSACSEECSVGARCAGDLTNVCLCIASEKNRVSMTEKYSSSPDGPPGR